jgi:AcrR family transcriptional regulator
VKRDQSVTSDEPQFRSLSREKRRERILWAAKLEMLDKGLDATSMEDVAARAGTTKPTVYAHFKSKDELFAAVVGFIKGHFLGKLRSPDDYSADPIEAIALFCGRLVELVCWRDAVGYQRVTLASAGRSPTIAQAVYDTMFAEASRILTAHLRAHNLTRNAAQHADLLLAATIGGLVLRHLYGIDESTGNLPDAKKIAAWVDLKRIREAVKLITVGWKV